MSVETEVHLKLLGVIAVLVALFFFPIDLHVLRRDHPGRATADGGKELVATWRQFEAMELHPRVKAIFSK